MCGLNSPFLRLWGFACRHGLGNRSGSKRNFWWLCWFGEWSLVVWWVCDPELDALMGVFCSVLVAVLVRCTVLCLSSMLTSVMPVLGQSFSLLPWPLWPWVCVLCSFPYRLYITKLLVSWEGGHMLPPSVAFAPLWSLLSVFFTLLFPPILSTAWFLSLEPSSFPLHLAIWLGKARASWLPCFIILNIPICPVTHTCTFLVFFPIFSFFLSRQLTLSSQLFLWHLRHGPPYLLLQNKRCDVPWSFSPLTRAIFSWPLYFTPSFPLPC